MYPQDNVNISCHLPNFTRLMQIDGLGLRLIGGLAGSQIMRTLWIPRGSGKLKAMKQYCYEGS